MNIVIRAMTTGARFTSRTIRVLISVSAEVQWKSEKITQNHLRSVDALERS